MISHFSNFLALKIGQLSESISMHVSLLTYLFKVNSNPTLDYLLFFKYLFFTFREPMHLFIKLVGWRTNGHAFCPF